MSQTLTITGGCTERVASVHVTGERDGVPVSIDLDLELPEGLEGAELANAAAQAATTLVLEALGKLQSMKTAGAASERPTTPPLH